MDDTPLMVTAQSVQVRFGRICIVNATFSSMPMGQQGTHARMSFIPLGFTSSCSKLSPSVGS